MVRGGTHAGLADHDSRLGLAIYNRGNMRWRDSHVAVEKVDCGQGWAYI